MSTQDIVATIESLSPEKREDLLKLLAAMTTPSADPFMVRIRERRERLKAEFGYFGTTEVLRELREEGR